MSRLRMAVVRVVVERYQTVSYYGSTPGPGTQPASAAVSANSHWTAKHHASSETIASTARRTTPGKIKQLILDLFYIKRIPKITWP